MTAVLPAQPQAAGAGKPRGHDVSSHQRNVDWDAARKNGAVFVYVKATEATSYRNPYFSRQYTGSREAGLLRGAYHFAVPHLSSGQTQAAHFLRNGGGWTPDGWTLPPALDVEWNPYDRRKPCYGLRRAEMVRWIAAFSEEVLRQTGRRPVIYTTTTWWRRCTGDSAAFGSGHPLWLARWAASPGPLPAGWRRPTFWQYAERGRLPGDQNLFNGSAVELKRFATA
ncbi:hydrolase [Streptomyces sp. LX-29]|uniref:GH25 family lysozyme n=1 Tax=Streptomyces sp. LX-29 TaxID=2900152 RepID=UPI00240E323C|nr:GH25 family lysozyme [Streptomyces sp. LX-29]WFB11859.1 hydrolase [Streptomyces sp. LX-29]